MITCSVIISALFCEGCEEISLINGCLLFVYNTILRSWHFLAFSADTIPVTATLSMSVLRHSWFLQESIL